MNDASNFPESEQPEAETTAENILAEKTSFFRFGDCHAKALDRQRILRPDVDVALVASGGATCDHHALKNRVGIALHDGLVHERAGVAFVAVADDVFLALRHPAESTTSAQISAGVMSKSAFSKAA